MLGFEAKDLSSTDHMLTILMCGLSLKGTREYVKLLENKDMFSIGGFCVVYKAANMIFSAVGEDEVNKIVNLIAK